MTARQAARPADVVALKALLTRLSGSLHYVAGGTDMLVVPRRLPSEGWLIDISGTQGLSGISTRDGVLQIGATTTLANLVTSAEVQRHMKVLAQAADLCGSAQIRNRATIGGNVANASPAGDLLPVLKCAGARFLLLARTGHTRILEFDGLVMGAGKTALQPGELITRVDVPLAPRLQHFVFAKLGPRDDLTLARVNLAMEADFDRATRRFGEVRLMAGAIGPVPLPLPAVAQTLAGQELTADNARSFAATLADAVDHAIPGRASQGYKRRAIMGVGLDLLTDLTGLADIAG